MPMEQFETLLDMLSVAQLHERMEALRYHMPILVKKVYPRGGGVKSRNTR